MVFIIRVQTPAGTKRLMFKDDQATWKDLQLQIKDVCKVEPASQRLSKTPLSTPQVRRERFLVGIPRLSFVWFWFWWSLSTSTWHKQLSSLPRLLA
jgi:hypothetical protein